MANTVLVKICKGSEFYPTLGGSVGRRHKTPPGQRRRSPGGRHYYFPNTGQETRPPFALGGDMSLPSKAVLYINVLKKIVQNKRQSVTASAHKAGRNVKDHGKLSSSSAKYAEGFVHLNPDNSMRWIILVSSSF